MSDVSRRFGSRNERSWKRAALAAALIFAIVVVLQIASGGTWYLGLSWLGAVGGLTSVWLRTRNWTEIAPGTVTVQNEGKKRMVAWSDIVEVSRRTTFSPVRMRLVSGEELILPEVEHKDMVEIRALIGLGQPGA